MRRFLFRGLDGFGLGFGFGFGLGLVFEGFFFDFAKPLPPESGRTGFPTGGCFGFGLGFGLVFEDFFFDFAKSLRFTELTYKLTRMLFMLVIRNRNFKQLPLVGS